MTASEVAGPPLRQTTTKVSSTSALTEVEPTTPNLARRCRDGLRVTPSGRLADPVHVATEVVLASSARDRKQRGEKQRAHAALSTCTVRNGFPVASPPR